ncbi:ankyrin repeat-containing domain protein [Aspergillus germanicus]
MLDSTFNDDLYEYYIRRHKRKARRPMMWAALNGKAESIRSLLGHGANFGAMDRSTVGEGAGHYEPSYKFIIQEQDLQERRKWCLSTPLCGAVRRRHLGVVRTLIRAGTEVNAHAKSDGLPIIWAVEAKQLEILAFLIRSGARCDIKLQGYRNLLGLAVSRGWSEGRRALLAPGRQNSLYTFHPNTQHFEQALRPAMECGNTNRVVPFLEAMENTNDQLFSKETPLKIAVEEGFAGTITCILDHEGQVYHPNHGKSWSALHAVVVRGDMETLKAILDNEVSTETRDSNGTTPRIACVLQEDSDMVDLLLRRGADPDARDNTGYTALLWAAKRGSPGMKQHLLPKSDFNALDPHGYTAVSIAVQGDCISAVRALLEADKVAGQQGTTAARNRLLIDKSDMRGRTPLFLATQYGAADVVKLLLCYGSEAVHIPTCTGRTPLSFAQAQRDSFTKSTTPVFESAVRDIQNIIQLLLTPTPADVNIGLIGPLQPYMSDFVAKCVICKVRISPYDYEIVCSKCPSRFDSHGPAMCFECAVPKEPCVHHTRSKYFEDWSDPAHDQTGDNDCYILSDHE